MKALILLLVSLSLLSIGMAEPHKGLSLIYMVAASVGAWATIVIGMRVSR